MLKITIAGQIKTGKTMMAAFIADKLLEIGVMVEWEDGRPADDLGLFKSLHRMHKVPEESLKTIFPKVEVCTEQKIRNSGQ